MWLNPPLGTSKPGPGRVHQALRHQGGHDRVQEQHHHVGGQRNPAGTTAATASQEVRPVDSPPIPTASRGGFFTPVVCRSSGFPLVCLKNYSKCVDTNKHKRDNSSNAANNAAPAKGKPQSVNLHRVGTVNRTGMEPSEPPTDEASHSQEWHHTNHPFRPVTAIQVRAKER